MSGEPIVITLETAPGAPSSFPVVLKKIMESPPPNILDGDDGKSSDTDGQERGMCRLTTNKQKNKVNRKNKARQMCPNYSFSAAKCVSMCATAPRPDRTQASH